ncbi:MAG: cytochrome c [Burkholderiales bacterium]|nr:cytochrome c [Burkholderiales bacterium]
MKVLTSSMIAFATLFVSTAVHAQAKPDDVIKFRKGVYQVVGWHNRTIGQMIKGQVPFDQAIFARNATLIAQLAQIAPDAFAPGSDKGDTRARPEIWSDAEGFRKVMSNFQAQATKLAEVAQTATSVDQVRSQAAALGKACAACHDAYRTK